MKPTQITELFANIRKTFVSFFSILMFVALGVGIFLGISWTAPALQSSAEEAFDEGSFHDFQIQFPYGLTDEDMAKLADVDGVTEVEAARLSYQTLAGGKGKYVVKVQSICERVDVPLVVEGELPDSASEIALQASSARDLGICVGDAITFEKDAPTEGDGQDPDGMKSLNAAEYTVTALVDSAEYLANDPATFGYSPLPSGGVDAVGWVMPDAFDPGAFEGGYPLVNVRCDDLRVAGTLSEDYRAKAREIESRIAELGSNLADARYEDLHSRAQQKVDEGERQLEEGKQRIADGEQQLEEGRQQFELQRSEGEDMLYSAYQELMKHESEMKKAKKLFNEAKDAFEDAKKRLSKMKDDETVVIAGETYTAKQLRKEIPKVEKVIAALEKEYKKAAAELEKGWKRYYAGQDELASRVAGAERQLAEGEAAVESAKEQVAENEPKLEEAKGRLAAMKDYDWTLMGRGYNAGVNEVSVFSDVTTQLSFSMAALFVIVGLLVSYSAVSRIVHEQITQIGTKKALGLRSREITASFLAYSALAVVAGSVIGVVVGLTLVEGIIGHVLGGLFYFGDYPPFFGLLLFLVVMALELVLVLGATWLACRSILRKHAVELLKGEEPPTAKTRFYEKWDVWEKLPLLTQTIVNNCVNDKRRVFSTIVGVAGCTALIVTAVTLNNDVLKSYDKHYEDVYGFNAIAYVDNGVEGAVDAVDEGLRSQGAATAQVMRKPYVMTEPDGDRATVRIIVPADEDAFGRLYHVNSLSGDPVDLSAEGAWVSQAYAEHHGAKVGDEITVDAGDGTMHQVRILGFYEFWLTYNEMVMGRDYFEREFDVAPVSNVVLANTGNASVDDMAPALRDAQGFDSIVDDKIYQSGNFKQFSSVSSAVVLIYLALSALMAVVVLLNLNVMFIEEKKRELIVLMINGFSTRDAKRYIYNDTIVLTLLGIAAGLVLGCVMGSITVASIEPVTASFVKGVDGPAVAIAIAGSAVLAFIMSVIALRRIPRFALTDINKV